MLPLGHGPGMCSAVTIIFLPGPNLERLRKWWNREEREASENDLDWNRAEVVTSEPAVGCGDMDDIEPAAT